MLQGAHVIGAVSAHQSDETLLVQRRYDELLLFRVEPGEHFHVRQDSLQKLALLGNEIAKALQEQKQGKKSGWTIEAKTVVIDFRMPNDNTLS
jgi:hypothetical protein